VNLAEMRIRDIGRASPTDLATVPINVGRAVKIVAFGDSNVVVDSLADTQHHSRSQGAVDPPLTVRNYGDEWRNLV
jgi:hypothetical protein